MKRSLIQAALAASMCLGFSSAAWGQCTGYEITPGTATFIPGSADIGLYADDSNLLVTFPFPISFYGNTYTSAYVDTNGFLDFTTSHGDFTYYTNQCVPAASSTPFDDENFGPVVLAHWDDLRTDQGGGQGIFTDVIGTAPNRTFVIEWHTGAYNGCATQNFEILFYENTSSFDLIYNDLGTCSGSSATVGVQDAALAAYTAYSCDAAVLPSGTSLHVRCITASEGACCDGLGGCLSKLPAACASGFQGPGTTCTPTNPCGGACCDLSGGCGVSTAALCTAPGSVFVNGAACSQNPCLGSCCNTDFGFCDISSGTDCAAPSIFGGPGTTCDTNPCPAAGTCCDNNSGACSVTTTASCFGSTFNPAVSCDPAPCLPAGICCTNLGGACTVIYGGGCTSSSSTAGSGTSCNPDSCPPIGNCCANIGGACTILYGGSCPTTSVAGGTVTCTPSPCVAIGSCCTNLGGACTVLYGGSCPTNATAGFLTSCAPASCQALGVCCDTITSACTVIYGGLCPPTANEDDSTQTCATTPCPPIAWACCLADGSCLSRFQNDCGALGGAWQAGGTCGTFVCSGAINLVQNPGATGTMDGWTLTANTGGGERPGDNVGWAADNDQAVHSGQHSFSTSYNLDERNQVIDLVAAGYTAAQIDAAPTIVAGEWVGPRSDAPLGCKYYVRVELLAADQTTVIAAIDHGTPDDMIFVAHDSPFFQDAMTFTGYGPGVRFVRFLDGGISVNFWLGHYGAHFDDAFVSVLTINTCCTGTACATMTIADCITGGGTPQATGVACASNPCGGGPSGVCCRGSTCNTSVGSTGCTPSGAAGAVFVAAAAQCNSGTSSSTPCCYADYNKAGGITVSDIFSFLSDWFAHRPAAVPGGDGASGTPTVASIFAFLSAWFARGC